MQIIQPLGLDRAAARNQRGGHYLQSFARLAPGTDLPVARAEMDGVIAGLIREYPDQHDQGNFGIALSPLRTDLLGDARPVLLVLAGPVGLVLLMACANVANRLLARGEARRRELAVRTALGASRFRLIRQMLTEAWLLSSAGAAAGLLVALWCQQLVVRFAPRALPRVPETSLNGIVLLCTAALGLLAGVIFGLIPALQVSRVQLADPMKDGARGNVVVKTPAEPDVMAAAVRDEVRRLDPEVPAAMVRDMDWIVADSTRDRRLNVIFFGAFGALALLLATVGLYGVMAFQVAQRTREMGVRLALGASRRDVLGMVVGQGMRLVGAGLAVGIVAAAVITGSFEAMLFDVAPRDLTIFAVVPALLLAAGALASYVPGRRATRVDPVTALRGD